MSSFPPPPPPPPSPGQRPPAGGPPLSRHSGNNNNNNNNTSIGRTMNHFPPAPLPRPPPPPSQPPPARIASVGPPSVNRPPPPANNNNFTRATSNLPTPPFHTSTPVHSFSAPATSLVPPPPPSPSSFPTSAPPQPHRPTITQPQLRNQPPPYSAPIHSQPSNMPPPIPSNHSSTSNNYPYGVPSSTYPSPPLQGATYSHSAPPSMTISTQQQPPPPPYNQQQPQGIYNNSNQPYPPHNQPSGHHGGPSPYPQPATTTTSHEILSHELPQLPLFTDPQEPVPANWYSPSATLSDPAFVPQAYSRYQVPSHDNGNASPDLVRPTVYAFPQQRGTWHQTGDIPLGLTCTPLQVPSVDVTPRPRTTPHQPTGVDWTPIQAVPVVDTTTGTPPRCQNCQAYWNVFNSKDQTCCFCKRYDANAGNNSGNQNNNWWGSSPSASSSTGSSANLVPTSSGTVEYIVDGPYVTRPTPVQACHYLYAIDLTSPYAAEYVAVLERIGHDLQRHIARQPQGQPVSARIGICWVSSMGIVLKSHKQNHVTIMSDVTEDPFCPMPLEDWTVDVMTVSTEPAWSDYLQSAWPSEVVTQWRSQAMRTNAYGLDGLDQSCGGAALQFLAHALAETGGRGTWVSSQRPNFGVGALSFVADSSSTGIKNNGKNNGVDEGATPIQLLAKSESADFYKKLGAECAKTRVSLNIVLHTRTTTTTGSNQYYGLATLGELCRVTCGQLVRLDQTTWEEILYEELCRQIYSFAGWDAIFKVRCSEGLHIKSFLIPNGTVVDGASIGGPPELELACVTSKSTISVEVEHRVGGIPKDVSTIYFQTALLYTNMFGQRRLRVSTLGVKATVVANDVFRSADIATVWTHLMLDACKALRNVPSNPADATKTLLQQARDNLYHRCLNILVNYRLHTPAITSPSGQLVLPERLNLLPLFCMCLLKSPMLRPGMPIKTPSGGMGVSPTCDERALYAWHLTQSPPFSSLHLLHPFVIRVDNSADGFGEFIDGEHEGLGLVIMPKPLPLSMESLEDDGIYLIDDGLRVYLYSGPTVSDELSQTIAEQMKDETRTSHMKERLQRLLWQLRACTSTQRGSESELRPTYLPMVPISPRRGIAPPDILNLMYHDATAGERDYATFVGTIQSRIRERLLAEKK